MKLKLTVGKHVQTDADGVERTYSAPVVFDNPQDLAKRWPEKFERVFESVHPVDMTKPRDGETFEQFAERMQSYIKGAKEAASVKVEAAVAAVSTLEAMSDDELLRMAEEEEVDISKAASRSEVVQTLARAHG